MSFGAKIVNVIDDVITFSRPDSSTSIMLSEPTKTETILQLNSGLTRSLLAFTLIQRSNLMSLSKHLQNPD